MCQKLSKLSNLKVVKNTDVSDELQNKNIDSLEHQAVSILIPNLLQVTSHKLHTSYNNLGEFVLVLTDEPLTSVIG